MQTAKKQKTSEEKGDSTCTIVAATENQNSQPKSQLVLPGVVLDSQPQKESRKRTRNSKYA